MVAKFTAQQNSFTAGEWSPSLYGRNDLGKYYSACKTLSNFIVLPHGGAVNRPGTKYIYDAKDQTHAVRLLPFVFSTTDAYVLEFGHEYFRVLKDGALVKSSAGAKTISAVEADSGKVKITTSTNHGYSAGDHIVLYDMTDGMGECEGKPFTVESVDADEFYLEGEPASAYNFGGGTAGKTALVYSVSTPWASTDLLELKFAQSADTMYVTHPDYPRYKITRTADDAWTITEIVDGPDPAKDCPRRLTLSVGSGTDNRYVVTAVTNEGVESDPTAPVVGGDTDTIQWYAPENGNAEYYKVYKDENKSQNFYYWVADVKATGSPMTWTDDETLADTAESAPDYVNRLTLEAKVTITSISAADPALVTTSTSHGYATGDWVWIQGAATLTACNQRRFQITVNNATSFYLDDVDMTWSAAGTGGTVQRFTPLMGGADTYPGVCGFFQQRLIYGRSNDLPQTIWGSRIGQYQHFGEHHPLVDDDSVAFTLDAQLMNAIEWIVPLDKLLVGTASNEWLVGPGSNQDALAPTSVLARVQSRWGCASLQPQLIGTQVLFLQYGSHRIRSLGYSLESDGYTGNDLTIYARHLFEGYTIVDMSYQRNPYGVLWCVRSDGGLLGLTYLPEHEVVAWHDHVITSGDVKSVCTIPDGSGNDVTYLAINYGASTTHIAYFQERSSDIDDAWFVDSGSLYEQTTPVEILSITDSGGDALFRTVGDVSHNLGSPTGLSRIPIQFADMPAEELNESTYYAVPVSAFTFKIGTSSVFGSAEVTYAELSDTDAGGTVSTAISKIPGFRHLDNIGATTVSVLADGAVLTGKTQTDGYVDVGGVYSKILIGLPYTSDLETLDLVYDTNQGTMRDRHRRGISASVMVDSSYDFYLGPSTSALRVTTFPSLPYTGSDEYQMYPGAGRATSLCIRNTRPVPVGISALMPRLEVGSD